LNVTVVILKEDILFGYHILCCNGSFRSSWFECAAELFRPTGLLFGMGWWWKGSVSVECLSCHFSTEFLQWGCQASLV